MTQTKWAMRAKQSQLHAPSCGGYRGSRTCRKAGAPKPPALIRPCSALPKDTQYLGSTASFSCFRDGTQNRTSCVISQKQRAKGDWLRPLFSHLKCSPRLKTLFQWTFGASLLVNWECGVGRKWESFHKIKLSPIIFSPGWSVSFITG